MKVKVDHVTVYQAVTVAGDTRNSFAVDQGYYIELDTDTGFFLLINKKKQGAHKYISHTNAAFWSLMDDDFAKCTEHLRPVQKSSAKDDGRKKLSETIVETKTEA